MEENIITVEKIQLYHDGYEYEIGSNGKTKCPCCGNYVFNEPNDWDFRPVCDFENAEPVIMNVFGGSRRKTLKQSKREWESRK